MTIYIFLKNSKRFLKVFKSSLAYLSCHLLKFIQKFLFGDYKYEAKEIIFSIFDVFLFWQRKERDINQKRMCTVV